LDDLVTALL